MVLGLFFCRLFLISISILSNQDKQNCQDKLKQFIMDCLGRRFKKSRGQNNQPLPQSQIGTNGYQSRVNQNNREESGCIPAKRTATSPNYAFSSPPNRASREHQYRQEQVVHQQRKSTSKEKKKGVLGGLFSKDKESSSSSEKNKEKKKGFFGFGNKSESSSDKEKNVAQRAPENLSYKQDKVAVIGGATGAVVTAKRSKSSSSRSSSSNKNKKSLVEKIKEHLTGSSSRVKQAQGDKNQQMIASTVVKETETPAENMVPIVANYIHDEFRDYDESNFKVKGISIPGVNIK